eukprot:CAMPEP_0114270086 /NCGR_PEP_ID=MMETSP0058-20121206/27027_1 /TAXON_ID=36894 /ORGANISM="Pyramimonas parkeae, CCMP726" /LENGTH=35 /DNA_ID= /DNA_START= /DNA_END= /DNA_ORIENTATION=
MSVCFVVEPCVAGSAASALTGSTAPEGEANTSKAA